MVARGTRVIRWATRYNTALTVAAASIAPILYLVFIDHDATNSFYGDDWSVAPMIRGALNNHLQLSQVWVQYNESRLVLGNIVDIAFGRIDHFDLRAVILFSAVLFVATYVFLLALFRHYLAARLTPIPRLASRADLVLSG